MKLQLYQPHANQIKVHQNEARYRVVVAGRRFGKSALSLNEALARAFQLKDQIIWIILPLFRQAKEIYWIDPDITKYFTPYLQARLIKMDKQELSIHVLSTNSWIRLKGSDNFNSLRGSGIDLIIWDEVADIKQEAFDVIEPALADSPSHRMLYVGTPRGLNHFHDFALKGNHNSIIQSHEKQITSHPDWQTWHFSSYDNATWSEGSVEREHFVSYIDEKKREAEEKGRLSFFNQEYMASFEESAGRFFPQWSYKTHVYEGRIIPRLGYKIFESMDWGRSAPFAWYAHVIVPETIILANEQTTFNRIYTFAELYGTQKSPYEWVEEIIEKRKQYRYAQPDKILVDPSMFNQQQDGSLSIVDQMNQAFEPLLGNYQQFARGTKNRKARWATMDNWMRPSADGLPYWMVTKDCGNLIRTLPLMEPSPNDMEDLNTELEDHATDSTSYFLPFIKWVDAKSGVIARIGSGRKGYQDPNSMNLDTWAE